MRRWLTMVNLAALTAGAGTVATGCGSSTAGHSTDASGQLDVGTTALGGRAGTGGWLGSGGAITTGGAPGTGGAMTGSTTGLGTGGRGGTTGSGGAATDGGPGPGGRVGTGGYGFAGVLGTGGGPAGRTGGTGGTATGGSDGGAARDASADGEKDGPGNDGDAAVVYSGCGYGGGIDRAVVARFDARAGVCVTLVLESPHSAPDASFGMTISPYWGVAAIFLWPSATADCATRNPIAGALGASSASGSVTVDRVSGTIDIEAVFDFPSSDAGPAQSVEMKAQAVDFMHNC